ncbi:MAG: undecaprenyl-diphosphate phosphatase [Candidatus Babeliales bacterium]
MLSFYRICATVLPIALEGLPVSSSGHVLLCAAILQKVCNVSFVETVPAALDHVVHLPIALLVALFFLPRWWYLLTHITRLWKQFFKMLFLGFITVSVTAVLYFLVSALGTAWFPLWLGYAITTALLFSLRYAPRNYMGGWSITTAPALGFVQGLALLPGISRLGITYTTARWLGMRPQKAFELSFLIEWPISVAGFIKGFYDLQKSDGMRMITIGDSSLMIIASIVGFFGLWLMQYLVRTDRVWMLGWYALALSIVAFF